MTSTSPIKNINSNESQSFDFIWEREIGTNLREILTDKYNIDELDVEDVLTDTQLSKIEFKSQYLYVALHFPSFDKARRSFLIKEVHCFITKEYLMVIDKNGFKHIQIFDNIKFSLQNGYSSPFQMFCEMIDFCITRAYRAIAKFKREIRELENQVFLLDSDEVASHDFIYEIQLVKKNMINYTSIISPLSTVITDLQTKFSPFVDIDGKERLDDSLDKLKKIDNNLKNLKEQLIMLTETNEAVTARSTNNVVKKLTGISLLISIPNILTSFFGMNVFFGWFGSDNNLPLTLVMLLIVGTELLVFFVLQKRGWI